jgi:hypothetical protein
LEPAVPYLTKYTSQRARRWMLTGVGLWLVGLIFWLTLPYYSGAHFYVSWGLYAVGFLGSP